MELRFVGTGAAFNPVMGSNSAVFARGENLYMIDCGEQTFARVVRSNILKAYTGGITIILTHMHADHAGSLGTFCLYAAEVLKRPPTIVHPNEDVRKLLALMGARDKTFRLQPDFAADGLTVTPIPTRHVQTIPAYSYLLTDEEGTIFYSGDTNELTADILEGLRSGSIAHAYLDVSYIEGDVPAEYAHLTYATLLSLAEPSLRSKFTLMHFNRDFYKIAERDGFLCAKVDPQFA